MIGIAVNVVVIEVPGSFTGTVTGHLASTAAHMPVLDSSSGPDIAVALSRSRSLDKLPSDTRDVVAISGISVPLAIDVSSNSSRLDG